MVTVQTGQWLRSEEGTRWYFDSGALCLDFANTGTVRGAPAWEQLATPADLVHWLGERFDLVAGQATAGELVDGLSLRAAIAAVTRAISDGDDPRPDDIDTINLYAATPNIPPTLAGGDRQAGRSAVRIGQALSTIARDAVQLFADHPHGRVRECAADDCELIFYDGSRSNNRRWCSMQRCGNRSKVRAHRHRIRETATP